MHRSKIIELFRILFWEVSVGVSLTAHLPSKNCVKKNHYLKSSSNDLTILLHGMAYFLGSSSGIC